MRAAAAARGGQHAIPFGGRRRLGDGAGRRSGAALFLRRPARPRPAVTVPAVVRQVFAQRSRLLARQIGNAGQDVEHALAVRAEQQGQRQRLQQLDGGGAPVAGLRHQPGHVAQLRHAHAPQLSGPLAAQGQGGDGLVDHDPGRLGARQPDVVAGAFERQGRIGGVEPETVALGRGSMCRRRHGGHYRRKCLPLCRRKPPVAWSTGTPVALATKTPAVFATKTPAVLPTQTTPFSPPRRAPAPAPLPAGCRPATWRDTGPCRRAPAHRPAPARRPRNTPGRC
ncbi:Uncharacterised protein [Achromobacter sp. 2789STDY5608615]|nr:Uncharacterised protein [Achromobacter sp. 2789STDY5608615]